MTPGGAVTARRLSRPRPCSRPGPLQRYPLPVARSKAAAHILRAVILTANIKKNTIYTVATGKKEPGAERVTRRVCIRTTSCCRYNGQVSFKGRSSVCPCRRRRPNEKHHKRPCFPPKHSRHRSSLRFQVRARVLNGRWRSKLGEDSQKPHD